MLSFYKEIREIFISAFRHIFPKRVTYKEIKDYPAHFIDTVENQKKEKEERMNT